MSIAVVVKVGNEHHNFFSWNYTAKMQSNHHLVVLANFSRHQSSLTAATGSFLFLTRVFVL